MTDYNCYRMEKGLTYGDIISAIQPRFEGYGKSQTSFVCNPSRYGVQLLPEAEKLLVEKFGYGNGLSIKKRRKENRSKQNRYTVRFDDETNGKIQAEMERMQCTAQQFFERAVSLWMYELSRKERI